jgi:hypothetical protein
MDDKGEQLTGMRRHVLHFDAGKLPPAATFWNVSMYGSNMLFVENDFGRYSIGSDGRTEEKRRWITDHRRSEEQASGHLKLASCPGGAFNLTLRLCGPQTPILDGSYRLPAVKRVN